VKFGGDSRCEVFTVSVLKLQNLVPSKPLLVRISTFVPNGAVQEPAGYG